MASLKLILPACILTACCALLVSAAQERVVAQQQANCPTCPASGTGGTPMCGCINCTFCNSGSFTNMCVCWQQQGKTVCQARHGDCKSGLCAECVETNLSTGRVCYTYLGCPGQACKSNYCTGNGLMAAAATSPCADCSVVESERTSNGLPVRVTIENPASIPVRITSFPAHAEGPRYLDVHNDSKAGLVALVIAVTYTAHNGHSQTVTVVADNWHMDSAFAGPGQPNAIPLTTDVRHAAGVARVVVRPMYAEFDDGTRVNAGGLDGFDCLSGRRTRLAAEMTAALEELERTGTTRESVSLAMNAHSGLSWLLVKMNQGGPDVVLAHLKSDRRFRP
jgi:hypothetical protein